ncbi:MULTISPECIES: hypothetical protein [unclassified Mesorhizobium]|uniref:hypothetical protein n=1 Tax=unclassified Mesorhizobium TaxID=325217 RepID=UPI0013E405F0|nr:MULTISPECIES: hypothetical protein [unclassified Mesorhizobium]
MAAARQAGQRYPMAVAFWWPERRATGCSLAGGVASGRRHVANDSKTMIDAIAVAAG